MLPVMWKQDHTLIFKSKLLKNIKSVAAGAELYSFTHSEKTNIRKQNWIIFQKTDSSLNWKNLDLNRDIGRFFAEIGWSGEILEIGSLPTKSGELTGMIMCLNLMTLF